jgi:hypothetical protein
MWKLGGRGAIVATLFLIAGACSSQGGKSIVPGTGGAGGSGNGGSGSGGAGDGGSGSGGSGTGGKDAGLPPDAAVCCPPDPLPITKESAHLGGAASRDGVCYVTSTVYLSCLSNWRVETDEQGCPILRMDYIDCPQARNDARLPDVHDAASDAD